MGSISDLSAGFGARDLTALMGGGGGGLFSAIGNLFKNPMFLQMLAAGGADIAQGTGGKNINSAIQGNIRSQAYMKLLSRMLAGDIPEGASIKHSDTGTTISMPREHLEDGDGGGLTTPMSARGGGGGASSLWGNQTGGMPTEAFNTVSGLPSPSFSPVSTTAVPTRVGPATTPIFNVGYPNPFVSDQSGFSASDLAGLAPEDITQALQLKQNQEALRQRSIAETADMIYKLKVLPEYYQGQLAGEAENAAIRRDQEFRQWYEFLNKDERTTFQKEFEFAKSQGFTGSPMDFKDYSTTGDWRNYQLAGGQKGTGKTFDQWLTAQNRSRATTINLSPAQRALSTASVDARVLLKSPENLDAFIAKKLSDPITVREMYRASKENPAAAADLKADITVRAIDQIIETGGGVSKAHMDPDGKTMVWVVTWTNEDGTKTTETIRYAIY